jgi:hypothetical protein
MKNAALIVLLLAVALAGCNEAPSPKAADSGRPQAIASKDSGEPSHNLILRYNKLLSEGYQATNMTKLQEVTTPELAEKAYYHMAALGEGKSRMVSELKKIEFLETDSSQGTKCRVITKETWDFAYADIQTGQRSGEVKDYIYNVQYLLENRQGRWVITEINASGEDRKELPSWSKMFGKK